MWPPFCPLCRSVVQYADGVVTCEGCGYKQGLPDEQDIELEPVQATRIMEGGAILLDVRTEQERAMANIEGSFFVPINELPQKLGDLPKGQMIITFCHHGNRSLHAARFLRQKGLRAKSLAGGIERWTEEIDPSIPSY